MRHNVFPWVGLLTLLIAIPTWANSPPQVTAVTAAQRGDGSMLVDISYDLADADGDACAVWVVVSDDGGVNWQVSAASFTGSVGTGILPGLGKQIVWDAGLDIPGTAGSNFKVRVYADDGFGTGGMALIPAGTFQMGDTFNEGYSEELPVHTVYLSAYYIDKYEVTKGFWDTVWTWAVSNGYDLGAGFGKAADHPVVRVNWYDCVKWSNARSQQEGRTPCYYTDAGLTTVYKTGQLTPYVKWNANGYRLPTEAEWEKAARGGVAGHRFPWSDTDTIQHARANYYSDSAYAYDTSPTRGYHPTFSTGGTPYTSPVGYFAPNGYGIYDMAGNVWEWCNDWYDGGYYSISPGSDPTGPGSGLYRVLRGDGWFFAAYYCRCAYRFNNFSPGDRYDYFGFRLVLDSP